MKNERRKNIIGISIVLVIFFALTVVLIVSFINRHQDKAFTAEKWNAYSWNNRQRLIKSFLEKYDLNKMTKGEIIKMLGPDTEYVFTYSIPFKTDDNLVYDFGLREHYAASNITLIIMFDENDHVSSYELKTYSQ